MFKSSFRQLSTHCISQLERFKNCRNYSFFCTFWHLRNLYSGATHHANYGERSSNHHFRHCAHCVYHIYSVLKIIEITFFFCTFWLYEISTPVMRTMVTMGNVAQIIIYDVEHTLYITFRAFWKLSKLQFVLNHLALRNFYSGHAHHANYCERCSNHHFRHCAHFVYHIYSVLELFKIAVGFAHFGFYEISTPVMPTTLRMGNIVSKNHFRRCAHCV